MWDSVPEGWQTAMCYCLPLADVGFGPLQYLAQDCREPERFQFGPVALWGRKASFVEHLQPAALRAIIGSPIDALRKYPGENAKIEKRASNVDECQPLGMVTSNGSETARHVYRSFQASTSRCGTSQTMATGKSRGCVLA